jgi:phosphoribosylformylglycinamidine synthase
MSAYLVVVRPRVVEAAKSHPLIAAARTLQIEIEAVWEERRYLLAGDLTARTLARLAQELLADPVLAEVAAGSLADLAAADEPLQADWVVDVAYRAGVTDNEGDSLALGAQRAGVSSITVARSVRRTLLRGPSRAEAEAVARGLLANDLVEATLVTRPGETDAVATFYRRLLDLPAQAPPLITTVPIREADEAELQAISAAGVLSLDRDELLTVQRYFRDLGRDPTDGELETIAQTWSEHCSHKTFKARIHYREEGAPDDQARLPPEYAMLAALSQGSVTVDGLLKTYLVAATERVRPPWLLSAFVDNAGIVAFGEDDAISVKVETHNHPSALEPFGGANTGVGGVVRDVLGVSARPIANLDVLCFGPPDEPRDELPPSILHPSRIAAGVVAGVRDYGNKLGVPTVAGAVLYDPGYTRNPLVFCGTVGLAPRGAHRQGPAPGDAVVVVGGRTGRDGIHGATFSSVELTHQTAETVGAAVQIGDPVTEKQVIDVLLQASEQALFRAITDCGAGGLSSAVGEMGERTGVAVELEDVHLKYPGLQPWEIWVSEAQERMVVAVPPASLEAFLELCGGEDVEATVIGHFTMDRRLVVSYRGVRLVDLDMALLHDGRPQREMQAVWAPPASEMETGAAHESIRDTLLALLGHPNIASKEPIVRTYDHLVQGRTIQGPLGGLAGDAPTDGAVLQPRHGWPEGIAIGCGINPRYGEIDPYWMALAACDEAVRNVVASGGDPERCALLDNFCWGDPREPDRLAGLVRAAAACYDASTSWGMPFISGKDSLNNEYRDAAGRRVPIPGTLLISAVAQVPTLECVTTTELKAAGDRLYLLGVTRDELGASHRLLLQYRVGSNVPRVDLALAPRLFRALHAAIRAGLVRACHDLSEGGLGVAAAEMAFGGNLGLELDLRRAPVDGAPLPDETLLWSESPSRFLVEVAPEDVQAFEAGFHDLPAVWIGEVTDRATLQIVGLAGEHVLDEPIAGLRAAWQRDSFIEKDRL